MVLHWGLSYNKKYFNEHAFMTKALIEFRFFSNSSHDKDISKYYIRTCQQGPVECPFNDKC